MVSQFTVRAVLVLEFNLRFCTAVVGVMNDVPAQADLIEEAPVALILRLYCVFAVREERSSDSADAAAVVVSAPVQDP